MSSAKITLLSFYEWLKWEEGDLFTELVLPEGIDKDVLTNNILIRGGEFEVVFSEPHFMQKAVGNWGKKLITWLIIHCSRAWSCTDHVTNHELISWL